MINFWKRRREAKQQRESEVLLEMQEVYADMYELAGPASLADELARVKASIERGRQNELDSL